MEEQDDPLVRLKEFFGPIIEFLILLGQNIVLVGGLGFVAILLLLYFFFSLLGF